ncbi:MAG: hypothetical protein L0H94_05255 [Nitrospira sp.]|nr:hypothetical protein [Nitrospira sp.]
MMELLQDLKRKVNELPRAQMPNLIGLLSILSGEAQMRLLTMESVPPPQEDRLLMVAEAAEKLGMTKDYLYRRADTFDFTVRVGVRRLRFSLNGIENYIARQGVSLS